MNHSAPLVFGEYLYSGGDGPHRADDPIRTDTEVAVADVRDLGGCQVDLPVGVGEQHEVVSRALPWRNGALSPWLQPIDGAVDEFGVVVVEPVQTGVALEPADLAPCIATGQFVTCSIAARSSRRPWSCAMAWA